MGDDIQKAAERFMSGKDGQRLMDKKSDIRRIAQSRDGEQVRGMLERGGFDQAVKSGDTEALRRAIESAMNTESGARLMGQLREMLKK